jgi:Zn-dependent protease with chaperone function
MTPVAFRELVHQLELRAGARPAAYKARVAALAALGYGYVFGMLGLLLVVAGMIVFGAVAAKNLLIVKALIPLLVVIGAVLQALWVKVPPPQGLVLNPRQAPSLFELARNTGRRLHAPRIDTILAIPDLNAVIVQVPRLGPFAWYRNYLLIGLPLLQAVSPEEWQAILAHEMGHLSGSHGRFSSWIYRLRMTWARLLETLESRRSLMGKFLFGDFVEWYAPHFNAYTFVLARAHEYEADAAAAEIVGAETVRRALMRSEVLTRVFNTFWATLPRRAVDTPDPPRDAHRWLRDALRAAPAAAEAATWISQAWRRPTDYSDTHPALADRLRALGWRPDDAGASPPPPPPPLADGPSAAQVYLGDAEATIEREFDQMWVRAALAPWKEWHVGLTRARARLAELDAQPDAALAPDVECERIRLCSELGDEPRAAALAQTLLERTPGHTGALFCVGRAALLRGDASGIASIEAVMGRDPESILPGCEILFDYFMSQGELERAECYREMAKERQGVLTRAEAERSRITVDAPLELHDFTPEQVAALQEDLRRFPDVGKAYLARRVLYVLPEQPCYLLGIVPRRRTLRSQNSTESIQLRDAIAAQARGPAPIYVFLLVNKAKGLERRLQRMPGAKLI